MYAKLVINIEAPLYELYHYYIPNDMQSMLAIGHLVEVDFNRRLAQGIVINFDETAPVEEVKPIIGLIDAEPIIQPWQIKLAQWMSERYLTPLNACIRLMLPPGLTRWSDVTIDINPHWDGSGRLTDPQKLMINLLRERGDMRGRQIAQATPKGFDWKSIVDQLSRREILTKASVLDPPRIRPKTIRTAELMVGKEQIIQAANKFGNNNKHADILLYLLLEEDPLPAEETVLNKTGTGNSHLDKLTDAGLIERTPATKIAVLVGDGADIPDIHKKVINQLPQPLSDVPDQNQIQAFQSNGLVQFVEQPPSLVLAVTRDEALTHVYRLRRAKKYLNVLRFLSVNHGPIPLTDIYAATDANLNHLRKLEDRGLIRLAQQEVWRDPLADRDFIPSEAPVLTPDQANVWEDIKNAMVANKFKSQHVGNSPSNQEIFPPNYPTSPNLAILLHGVTGSGKTEIYLRAVELALKRGQQAIVLVPEIALTPQTVRRFATRFPDQVAVLHSRLTDGERYDTWRRARQNQFSIVVGPRSALFTPFKNTGVIILDEEHDNSYKQTPPVPPPYYHAREVAVELGRLIGAMVIMGSATPNVVTYHKARAGQYNLLELPKRIMGHRRRIEGQVERTRRASMYHRQTGDPDDALTIPLPPVQLVDLRQELRAGNRSIFSRILQKELNETLARGEQTILFLNRRGTATFVMCRDCGLVLNCPRCDMPLTYHRPGAMLECHYCGRKEPPHDNCPNCGSHRIKYFGLGTEEVQRLVQIQWPEARTIRWDRDTTAGRDTHEDLLASFINQEADILVGTQMIAKGLDLPLVTLVGVISADVSLGLPDYTIGERTFQILTQVAGRAGRGLLGGRVIVQTYQPEHYAIQAAAEHDYTNFYLDEIRFRTQHNLPPFRRLARLIIADPIRDRAEKEAHQLAGSLRSLAREIGMVSTEFLGPVPPFFHRLEGRYRWQIIIRSPDPVRLLKNHQIPPRWIVDIDPVSTL